MAFGASSLRALLEGSEKEPLMALFCFSLRQNRSARSPGAHLIPLLLSLALAGAWLLPNPAQALSLDLGFSCVPYAGADADNCATGARQFAAQVSDDGLAPGQVMFSFTNSAESSASITEVFFEDGAYLALATIYDDAPQVEFILDESAGSMPNSDELAPPFISTEHMKVPDSRGPVRGVNRASESLGLLFDLHAGVDAEDVLAALASGDLRVAVVGSGFALGGNESFVGAVVVPEPSALLLLAAAIAGLLALRRRRSQRVAPPRVRSPAPLYARRC